MARIKMKIAHLLFFILFFHYANANSVPLRQNNAVWSRSIFFRGLDPTTKEKLNDKTLSSFASNLRNNHIHFAYIFAGPFQKDGHLPSYAFSEKARTNIARLKQLYPELKILPWIGGIENKTVFLESKEWIENSINDTVKLVKTMPIDGVHIDFEYVLFPSSSASTHKLSNYDNDWILFHKNLREALPHTFLSTVLVSSSKATKPWKHKHSQQILFTVSKYFNQIALMFYETGIHDLASYKDAIRDQLLQIKEMKMTLGVKSPKYLFGIGAFKKQKTFQAYRDMKLENINTTLTLLNEIEKTISPDVLIIDGLAIYCEWQATTNDWNEINLKLK